MAPSQKRSVSKSLLKAKMLEYFRQVEQSGEELIVTSDGKPVLKVVPYQEKRTTSSVFEGLQGKLSWTGDIDAPTEEEWEIR